MAMFPQPLCRHGANYTPLYIFIHEKMVYDNALHFLFYSDLLLLQCVHWFCWIANENLKNVDKMHIATAVSWGAMED